MRKLKPYPVWRAKAFPHSVNSLKKTNTREYRGGGGLSSSSYRLMGIYRWMGSHFYSLIDYYGVAVSIELLEWDRTFSGFGGSENSGR